MQIQCPQCDNKVDVDAESWTSTVDCNVCGSTFHPEPGETAIMPTQKKHGMIGPFELLGEAGRGAHGTVWQARDTKLDRTVALKIPRSDRLTQGQMEMFLREAQAAAQLRHPNIVSIHEAGRDGGLVYIVTDFVHGVTLSAWLSSQRRKRVSPGEAVKLCLKLASALHHAHQLGIVHRDIKPSNIMLDNHGEPYIMDFGLAKREEADLTISADGYIMGTPAYMSPEQASGRSDQADRRADIYSLGVVLFELLTGELPFRGTEQMMLKQIIETDAPSPRKLNAAIPKDLETLCLKCLEKPPANRFQTAQELVEELERFDRGEPILARPITRVDRAWRWCRRNPVVSSLAMALFLSLVGGFAGVTAQWLRANAHARDAVASAVRAEDAAQGERRAHGLTEQYLYVAHMNMAQHAYELTDPQRASEILTRHRPAKPHDVDRRSFEWHYWWRQTHRWNQEMNVGASVHRAAVSTDGATIAAADEEGRITLWDSVTGESRGELTGHRSAIFSVAFSPTSRVLASAGRDKTIRLWNLDNMTQLAAQDAQSSIFSLAISRDGKQLVTGGADLTVRLWDADSLHLLQTFAGDPHRQEPVDPTQTKGHFDVVYAIDISQDGQRIASAGLDRTVRLWSADGNQLHVMTGHHLEVWSVAFSPDGRTLASGSADHTIRLWDTDSGELRASIDAHDDRVRHLTFSPDGKTLASASHDRTVKLWDMSFEAQPLAVTYRDLERRSGHFFERMQLPNDGFQKEILKGHAGEVTSVAFSANGTTLVSSSNDGSLLQWSLSELAQRSTLSAHEKTVNSLAISADGRTMLSASNDRTARFWDLATMREIGEPLRHDGLVLCTALSPDGRMFATGSMDGQVRLGALAAGAPTVLTAHHAPASAVAFSPDSELLATASHDGTVRLWDVLTGQPTSTFAGHEGRVQSVVFLEDGHQIASAGADGTIYVWDVGTTEIQQSWLAHDSLIWSLARSIDGNHLASASADRTVKLWDLPTGELARVFQGHAETVRCVTFCPDGKTLASGSDDKTIKLWDLQTGEPKTTLKGHRYRVWTLAFTPDSQRLFSGSLIIRVW